MTLKPYADTPGRLGRQLVSDLAMVVWIYLWIQVGQAVHDAIASVGVVGTTLEGAASGVADGLNRAGEAAGRIPLVGDRLAEPLTGAGGEASGVAAAGRELTDAVDYLADLAGLTTAIAPIVSVLLIWGLLRFRFARRAGATAELASSPAGESLLALRALATRPVHVLTAVSADPVAAWRSGDRDVIRRLAVLETSRSGVRVPQRLQPAITGPDQG